MTWVQLGLAAVIGLPVAVIIAMIFWPSDYSAPPPAEAPKGVRGADPLRQSDAGSRSRLEVVRSTDTLNPARQTMPLPRYSAPQPPST